ncbi:hypothetical protein KY319_02900 [Candidatus Woesearchaeota archaeon]|nr:hypothetical protein [Candidatus Woesearchaeota archaeon]
MVWYKRAQAGEPLWYGFLFLPLTVIIVLAIIIMPRSIMGDSVQPVPLDEQVQAKQIMSRMWETNAITGRTSPFQYTGDLTGINNTYTKKLMAYSVTLDGKTTIHQKQFYDMAKPIAPFRYLSYTEVRKVNVKGTEKQLIIEEYYPKKYETKT